MMKRDYGNTLLEFIGEIYGEATRFYELPNKLNLLEINDSPQQSITTFISFGLSKFNLKLTDENLIKCELVFSTCIGEVCNGVPYFMEMLTDVIVKLKQAPHHGEVIKTPVLFPNKGMSHLYFCPPVIYSTNDSDFTYIQDNRKITFIWCFPIYDIEAKYIVQYGWEKFEEYLENNNIEVWDIYRKPCIDGIVLGT